MKCFITGYRGFIAQYLKEHLVSNDDEIIGHTSSLEDNESLWIPHNTDIVWHLGAHSRPEESMRLRNRYLKANTEGTLDILQEVKRNSPEAKVVIFGSATQDYLDSWYGYTKKMAELCANAFAKFDGLKIYQLKLFGIVGVGHKGDVINDFAQQAATNKCIKHGRLDYVRDISDVRDAVPAIYSIVTKLPPDTYYIGSW